MNRQIDWEARPEHVKPGESYPLLRCPAGKMQPLLVLSERLIGVHTHWLHGRSTPHTVDGCEGCEAGRPMRWHGYLCVVDERRRQTAILEISEACLRGIDDYILLFGTLRGARISLSRPNGKINGRVVADLQPSSLPASEIPPLFDAPKILKHMWETTPKGKQPAIETPRTVAPETPAERKNFEKSKAKAKAQTNGQTPGPDRPYNPHDD